MSAQEKSMEVAHRLRLFIQWAGMSIADFAELSGIPYGTLQQYLTNRRVPGGEHLARMAARGVPVSWLLEGRREGAVDVLPSLLSIGGPVSAWPELVQSLWNHTGDYLDSYHNKLKGDGCSEPFRFQMSSALTFFIGILIEVEKDANRVLGWRKAGLSAEEVAGLIFAPLWKIEWRHGPKADTEHDKGNIS